MEPDIPQSMRLAGRVAVITGAGRGLGKAVAQRFSMEGALVVVNDIERSYAERTAESIDEKLRKALPVQADVSRMDQVEEMFERAVQRFEKVDILINCAAVRNDLPLERITESDWDKTLNPNLKGSFNCAHVAQRYMADRGYGKIVLFSSPFPPGMPGVGQAPYSAAGSGVEGLTRALAVELGKYGINVNCIAPDFFDTDMTRTAARKAGMYMEDYRKLVVAQIPLRRMGKPEEIASLALFLSTDESAFITGQVITIRGGP